MTKQELARFTTFIDKIERNIGVLLGKALVLQNLIKERR